MRVRVIYQINKQRVNKMKTNKLLTAIAMLVIVGILGLACSSDPASSDKNGSIDDAPEAPELTELEPDLSYFEENTAPEEDAENYSMAQIYASSFSSMLTITSGFYESFFSNFDYDEGYFKNGIWNWEWNYNYVGVSMQVKYTAEEKSDRILWNLYISYDDGEERFENLNFISGEIMKDGSYSSWIYKNFDEDTGQESIAFKTERTKHSDGIITIEMEMYDEDTNEVEMIISYTNDGAEYTIEIKEADAETMYIYWNTDTNDGYYKISYENNTKCWDSSLHNTECPS